MIIDRDRVFRDTVLLIGNGISMDLRAHAGEVLRPWDTRFPLSWDVPNPVQPGRRLMQDLPLLQLRLEAARAAHPLADDFTICREIVHSWGAHGPVPPAVTELRHYLALAFTYYQHAVYRSGALRDWPWTSFLGQVASQLCAIVSLNYDLNVESALRGLGQPIRHIAVNKAADGIPLIKPHGSIQYEALDRWNSPLPRTLPLTMYLELIDSSLMLVPPGREFEPRLVPSLVVPGELSRYRDFQWSRAGRIWLAECRPFARQLLICGVSYAVEDRPEIDELLDVFDADTSVVVADPAPSQALMLVLRTRFNRVSHWATGFERPCQPGLTFHTSQLWNAM